MHTHIYIHYRLTESKVEWKEGGREVSNLHPLEIMSIFIYNLANGASDEIVGLKFCTA